MKFWRNLRYAHKGIKPLDASIPSGKTGLDIEFKYFDGNGTETTMRQASCNWNEQVQIVETSNETLINGVVYEKPALALLDDDHFTEYPLPVDKPTYVRIDTKKSKRIPLALKRFWKASQQPFFVYLPDKNNQFTIGAWVDSLKIKVLPA